jgi:lipopolysaccharide biosynthesis glycosyltransferase
MTKKKIAFIFAFTQNLSFAAGNCAIALNRYLSLDDYDIVMLHGPLPDKDLKALSKIPHVVLRDFALNDKFVDHMLINIPKESRFRTRNQLMCFAHFEAFRLLNEYEIVIYNDVDIGIQADISDILKYQPFGLTPDIPWKVANQFTREIPGYDMNKPSYCSGVMVLNDSIPYKKILEFLYKKAWDYADALINPDQSIINIALQEFNITPKLVPLEEYNCISWKDEAITAKIVHFGTEKKVWNNTNICNSFPEWYRNHKIWLALGGSDFDQTKITPRNPRGSLDYLDKLVKEKAEFEKKAKEEKAKEEKAKKQSVEIKKYVCLGVPILKVERRNDIQRYRLFGKWSIFKIIKSK